MAGVLDLVDNAFLLFYLSEWPEGPRPVLITNNNFSRVYVADLYRERQQTQVIAATYQCNLSYLHPTPSIYRMSSLRSSNRDLRISLLVAENL